MKYFGSEYYVTFHAINGSYYYQAFIFLVHMLFTLFFIIGYRTNLSKFLVWALTISLQEHCPFVGTFFPFFAYLLLGHGGDVYHRIILFWAMFLPVSEVWSLDATLKGNDFLVVTHGD
jgi:hypothetical protein